MQPPEIHIFLKSPKSQSKECHIIFDYDQGKKKFFGSIISLLLQIDLHFQASECSKE